MIGFPFILLAWWPLGIQWISEQLRIDPRTFMLLAITGFLLLAVFELLTIVSQQDRKITTLAQTVGILMEEQASAKQRANHKAATSAVEARPGYQGAV